MNKNNTIQENIKFLIMMYKRDIKDKETTEEEKEIYENFIYELETILELNK